MNLQFRANRQKYEFVRTVYTNVSEGYLNDSGSNWGYWEMFRESIQNMMDEAEFQAREKDGQMLDFCQLWADSKHITLRDLGRGVQWERIFLIGESGKRGNPLFRGQKGEGEVLSFLVAARLGIEKWMFSQDWALTARLDCWEGTEYKVLVLDLYKASSSIVGTIWRYPNIPELLDYFKNRDAYFPTLSRRAMRRQQAEDRRAYEKWVREEKKFQRHAVQQRLAKSTSSRRLIFSPRRGQTPSLYVKGIFVKNLPRALFSYNLSVELNRDRNLVDDFTIFNGIQEAFNSPDMKSRQMVEYWRHATDDYADYLEYRNPIIVSEEKKKAFRAAFNQVWGKKACLFTDRFAAIDAGHLGWKVLQLSVYAAKTALDLGVPRDTAVAGHIGSVVKMHNIPAWIQEKCNILNEIGTALGVRTTKIEPVERFRDVAETAVNGYLENGVIYILRHQFDRDELLETYLEELAHFNTGLPDGHRGLYNWTNHLLAKALRGDLPDVRSLILKLASVTGAS